MTNMCDHCGAAHVPLGAIFGPIPGVRPRLPRPPNQPRDLLHLCQPCFGALTYGVDSAGDVPARTADA